MSYLLANGQYLTVGNQILLVPDIGSGGYDTDAQAFFDRMITTPTTEVKDILNTFVVDSKALGVWQKADIIIMPILQDASSSLLNMVSSSFPGTVGSKVTFTPYKGWDVSSYLYEITFQYNPSTNGVNFVDGDATLIVWTIDTSSSDKTYFKSVGSFDKYFYNYRTGFRYTNYPNFNAIAQSPSTGILQTWCARQTGTTYYALRPDRTWSSGTNAGTMAYDRTMQLTGAYGDGPGMFAKLGYVGAYINETDFNSFQAIGMTAINALTLLI